MRNLDIHIRWRDRFLNHRFEFDDPKRNVPVRLSAAVRSMATHRTVIQQPEKVNTLLYPESIASSQ